MKFLKYFPFIIILCLLFLSSGQTYEEQTLVQILEENLPNKPLEKTLSHLKIPYWSKFVSIEERGYYPFVEFLIRKSTHIITFLTLAMATFLIFKRYRLSFLITVFIALIDEFHQSFTSGRTASGYDVGLDIIGALIGLVVLKIVLSKPNL